MKIEVLNIGGSMVLVGNNHMTAEREKALTDAQALASMQKFGLEPILENVPEYFRRLKNTLFVEV